MACQKTLDCHLKWPKVPKNIKRMLNPSPIPVLVFPECKSCGLEIQETNQRTQPGTSPGFGTSQHWYRLPVTVVSQQLLAICDTIRNDFLVLFIVCSCNRGLFLFGLQYRATCDSVHTIKYLQERCHHHQWSHWHCLVLHACAEQVGSAETENSQMATQLQKLQDKNLHHHEDSIFNSPGPATWWASVVICWINAWCMSHMTVWVKLVFDLERIKWLIYGVQTGCNLSPNDCNVVPSQKQKKQYKSKKYVICHFKQHLHNPWNEIRQLTTTEEVAATGLNQVGQKNAANLSLVMLVMT